MVMEGKNKDLTRQLMENVKDCAEMKTLIDTLKEQIKELEEIEIKAKKLVSFYELHM